MMVICSVSQPATQHFRANFAKASLINLTIAMMCEPAKAE